MADRDLIVRIIGDDRSLQQSLGTSQRRLQQFSVGVEGIGKTIGKAFIAAGVVLGTREVFQFLGDGIEAASALNEEVSKSQQVFGASSQAIEDWSKTTADSFGIAQREALAATGTFGNLFSTIGIATDQASAMSRTLVELAADLASFNNADPSDVLQAIRSGLIGEAEPLRRYGVLLSEARVQQLALASSGKQNVRELTNQEKALARYEIILQDTANAQGDFARTSDSLANQSRILKANIAELQAELGRNLVPAILAATRAANGLFDAFEAFRSGGGGTIRINVEEADLASLVAARDRIADLKGESNLLVQALDQVIARLRSIEPLRPDDRGGLLGVGAIAASNLAVDDRQARAEQEKAKKQLAEARKRFEDFIKGMGLKLDRAGLTASLNDDLAVYREIENAIRRRIAAEGRTFELVSQLTQVQLRIADIIEQQSIAAEQAQADAIDRRLEQQRRAREARRRRLDQAAARRERNQFQALGLTSGGSQRVPGVDALRRRLGNVRQQVEGTVLDTSKTEQQLDKIAAVLRGKFGKVGRDVRQAILGMLNDISSALEGKGAKTGPMTKFQKRGIEELIDGLGLSEQEVKALRQRFAQMGVGGTVPREGLGAFGMNISGPSTGTTGGSVVIENHLYIDGIEQQITKQQQLRKSRTAAQRRGVRPGIGGV